MVGGICGVCFVAHGHQSAAHGFAFFAVAVLSGKILAVFKRVLTHERQM
jgi:hypothetical protein